MAVSPTAGRAAVARVDLVVPGKKHSRACVGAVSEGREAAGLGVGECGRRSVGHGWRGCGGEEVGRAVMQGAASSEQRAGRAGSSEQGAGTGEQVVAKRVGTLSCRRRCRPRRSKGHPACCASRSGRNHSNHAATAFKHMEPVSLLASPRLSPLLSPLRSFPSSVCPAAHLVHRVLDLRPTGRLRHHRPTATASNHVPEDHRKVRVTIYCLGQRRQWKDKAQALSQEDKQLDDQWQCLCHKGSERAGQRQCLGHKGS